MLSDTIPPNKLFKIRAFEVKDEDIPAFENMPFEDIEELSLEHPGARDPEYRKRRDYIASLAKSFRRTGRITDVEYNEEEQNVWRLVASELEELHQKKASPFYLKAKESLGISNDRIPQLTEMTKRLQETINFRLAPIGGWSIREHFSAGFRGERCFLLNI